MTATAPTSQAPSGTPAIRPHDPANLIEVSREAVPLGREVANILRVWIGAAQQLQSADDVGPENLDGALHPDLTFGH